MDAKHADRAPDHGTFHAPDNAQGDLPGDLSTTQVYLAVTGSGLEQTAMANPARALLRKPIAPPQVNPAAE
ncbi:MAG: hypothetical protein ABR540_18785 [Acidimicrobiales bacterium]